MENTCFRKRRIILVSRWVLKLGNLRASRRTPALQAEHWKPGVLTGSERLSLGGAAGSLLEVTWGHLMSIPIILERPEKCCSLRGTFYKDFLPGTLVSHLHTSETFIISRIIARCAWFCVIHTSLLFHCPDMLMATYHLYYYLLDFFFIQNHDIYEITFLKHRLDELYKY